LETTFGTAEYLREDLTSHVTNKVLGEVELLKMMELVETVDDSLGSIVIDL
jgi:hypothetical protein